MTSATVVVSPAKKPQKWVDNNPCLSASEASYKCLEENAYDKGKCQEFFDSYKSCKTKMLEDRRKQRMEGML